MIQRHIRSICTAFLTGTAGLAIAYADDQNNEANELEYHVVRNDKEMTNTDINQVVSKNENNNGLSEILEEDLEPFQGSFKLNSGFEGTFSKLNDLSFNKEGSDDTQETELEIQSSFSYRPSAKLSSFAEIKLIGIYENPPFDESRISEEGLERGETWLYFKRIFDRQFFIKIGRQNLIEPRRWWWDDDLDAVRLYFAEEPWYWYLGIAEELARTSTIADFIDPENENVQRLFGMANWQLSDVLDITAFYLNQRDQSPTSKLGSFINQAREDESDADLQWLGLRASGELDLIGDHQIEYWLDTAYVEGDETKLEFEDATPSSSIVSDQDVMQVRGWAIDMGVIWTLPYSDQTTLAVNYAYGSGDKNPDDEIDHAFRQTGLQDTDEEFRFYGELLRPELSNLRVFTLALGIPLYEDNLLRLGYHRFRQIYASPFMRESRLEIDPNGRNKDIGSEISLILEINAWEDWEVEIAAAAFKSGSAFDAADVRANSIFFQLAYEF